jgi:hypothetical protein
MLVTPNGLGCAHAPVLSVLPAEFDIGTAALAANLRSLERTRMLGACNVFPEDRNLAARIQKYAVFVVGPLFLCVCVCVCVGVCVCVCVCV